MRRAYRRNTEKRSKVEDEDDDEGVMCSSRGPLNTGTKIQRERGKDKAACALTSA